MPSENIKELLTFLDSSHSVYHAIANVIHELEEKGYTPLREGENWQLRQGGR